MAENNAMFNHIFTDIPIKNILRVYIGKTVNKQRIVCDRISRVTCSYFISYLHLLFSITILAECTWP